MSSPSVRPVSPPPRDLPHNVEAEQAVLGALLLDETAFDQVAPLIKTGDFYLPAHQRVFGACAELAAAGKPVDPVLVNHRLDSLGLLGAAVPKELVFGLARGVGVTGNVVHYARVVEGHAATRRLLQAAGRLVEHGGEPDVARGQVLSDLRGALELVDTGAPGASKTRLLSVADIFAPLPPVPWLCQALDMAPGAPLLVAGYGFSGKTVSAQDLALAVATGSPAWGRFPVRAGRVLHVDYEQGAHLTRSRYQRLAAARGVDPRSLEGRLVLAPMPGWYLDGDAGDELARLAEGFDLVVVDSFRAACPHTDENSSDARVPLDHLTRISEDTGATWVVIHHARKPSQNATGGARMSVRGSGALFDACGSVLVFAAEKGEPVAVEHEKARISGRPHPAFQLWIEDVEVDGNPTGGLRVSAMSSPPPAQQSGSERLLAMEERVLAFVAGQGGTAGGLNIITKHLGARKVDVKDAVAELVRTGRLHRGGTYHEPSFSLTGTDGRQE